MALLAESVVEEWLNRNGFFTIRGIKHGVGELDLLGIKKSGDSIKGWHVEVQASFRPIGYISKLTKDLAKDRARTSSVTRTADEIELCARQWVKDNSKLLINRRSVRNVGQGSFGNFTWFTAKCENPMSFACSSKRASRVIRFMKFSMNFR